jgi:hypothetical protein
MEMVTMRNLMLTRVMAVIAPAVVAAGSGVVTAEGPRGPLAGLPGKPGPHIEKVKALNDNEWLNLGAPEADPKWGKGRGRSWGARMPYAPDLRAAFLFGGGVHCWWNQENNRFMDDLFAYDVNGHRWVCVHPGSDVKNLLLKMDANGFEVNQDGHPVPVAQLGHGYEQITYDTDRKKFMFMPAGTSDFLCAPLIERRKLWGGGYPWPYTPNQCSPWMYNVATDRFEIQKTQGPAPRSALGDILVYLPSMKKLFYWRGREKTVWLYDPQGNTWANLKPKGPPPPFGIDANACLDSKRGRIYFGGGHYPVAQDHAFWCYDIESNAWVDLEPKGKPCRGCNRYGTNKAVMNYDATSDTVVLIFHRWEMAPADGEVKPGPESRGIYTYHPGTNTWSETPLAMPKEKELGACLNSFYSPELNAHFVHGAGDSQDNGVMWVYRYKKGAR